MTNWTICYSLGMLCLIMCHNVTVSKKLSHTFYKMSSTYVCGYNKSSSIHHLFLQQLPTFSIILRMSCANYINSAVPVCFYSQKLGIPHVSSPVPSPAQLRTICQAGRQLHAQSSMQYSIKSQNPEERQSHVATPLFHAGHYRFQYKCACPHQRAQILCQITSCVEEKWGPTRLL